VPEPTYALLSSVLELYELYQRFSPAGPYRLELFLSPGDSQLWQAEAGRRIAAIDELIRGGNCLLANQHPRAARHVVAALWAEVRAFWREAQFAWAGKVSSVEPEKFERITQQLAVEDTDAEQVVTALGEVLAVYLLVLALRSAELAELAEPAVRRFRLAQR
jgi:hypothetical protein